MKKFWWPPWAYETRPAAALVLGGVMAAICLAVSLTQGSWSGLSTGLFGAGVVLAVYGAITKQLRREYRQSSKWARQNPDQDADSAPADKQNP